MGAPQKNSWLLKSLYISVTYTLKSGLCNKLCNAVWGICVTRLIRSQEVMPRSLVFKTTGFMEQPFSTSLHQKVFN